MAAITADEAYHDETAYDQKSLDSYVTSLASSVKEHRWQNGRRYHSFREGAYNFPDDEEEQKRMDLLHHVDKLVMNDALYYAPLPKRKPMRVLDVGTGTGLWAVEFGEQFSEAEVIGNDLSPIQSEWVPPNVHFEIDDVESPWVPTEPYDYIHTRCMLGSISSWPTLVQRIYENTSSGGWVEFQDYHVLSYSEDGSLEAKDPNNKFLEATKIMDECLKKIGKEANPGRKLEGWVRDVGFQKIEHKMVKLPVGPWPKDKTQKQVGALFLLNWLDGLEATFLGLLTRVEGWSYEEVQAFLEEVRRDIRKRAIHMVNEFHIVWAQKP